VVPPGFFLIAGLPPPEDNQNLDHLVDYGARHSPLTHKISVFVNAVLLQASIDDFRQSRQDF
jgi:hypothetical protein